jgi:3-dehydroquinate synthase
MTHYFSFAATKTVVHIQNNIPSLDDINICFNELDISKILFIADSNTERFVRRISPKTSLNLCVLNAGEQEKNWCSVEKILSAARNAGLGRDAVFIGVGGGVVTDIAGFAASVYMRGVKLVFISTTLLGMADAAVGGKTGVDLFGLKNLVGTFYPASVVYMPIETIQTLPSAEIKSGFAEIIKTAILDKTNDNDDTFNKITAAANGNGLEDTIGKTVEIKGRIVETDPHETGSARALLNLGHTFGHALESALGLGVISHGEAVAWGIARSCELGVLLGITPEHRAQKIKAFLLDSGYEISKPNYGGSFTNLFMNALSGDKKKSGGTLKFIVPAKSGAQIVCIESAKINIIKDIITK